MRIIAYAAIRQFGETHPAVMSSIRAWYKVARSKDVMWKKPQEIVETFGAGIVDILHNNRVCIDLAGTDVRLVLKVEYGFGVAFVRWIGWHKDYERLGNRIHTI